MTPDQVVGVGMMIAAVLGTGGILIVHRVLTWRKDRVDVADQEDPDPEAMCLECGGAGVLQNLIGETRVETTCGYCQGLGVRDEDAEPTVRLLVDVVYDWDTERDFDGAA